MFSGVLKLQEKDYVKLNDAPEQAGAPKAVVGPGTGLGQGYLTKSEFAPYYEVYPTEGGHCDYAARNQEDIDLITFAKTYLEISDNVENLRGKGHTKHVSVERICAGPGVPLLYDFLASRHPELERTLEKEGHDFTTLTSKMIINKGLQDNDPLCLKVIEKFTEILGAEVGNLCLKTLPFGGLYLIGGVTMGIKDYIISTDTFTDNFY